MNAAPGEDVHDWPTRDGYFAPRSSVPSDALPAVGAARRAAAEVRLRFPEVISVHLCGSVLEHGVVPADVDLAVVVADEAAALPAVADVLAGCDTSLGGREKARAWDVLVERRGAVLRNPLRCMPLVFRSLQVAGTSPWRGAPRIAADATTASKLSAPRKRELTGSLVALRDAEAARRPETAGWLARVQKRALRFGMLEALAILGAYSAVPARCAQLIGRARPELASLALEVSDDLGRGYAGAPAFRRLVELARALLAPGAR